MTLNTDGEESEGNMSSVVLNQFVEFMQVFQELPMEFAAEVNQLMSLKLEGSVG